jgi:hypothetical protein
MKNKSFLLIYLLALPIIALHAQCFHYENMTDIFGKSTTEINTFLGQNNWKEGKPNAFNTFGRSIKSWSLNNDIGAICWLDVCYKAGAKNIIVYQFISLDNYKEIKDMVQMNGFVQQKMKVSTNDMFYAFVKNDQCFILRKHTYDHETAGNFAILLIPAAELPKIWESYAK